MSFFKFQTSSYTLEYVYSWTSVIKSNKSSIVSTVTSIETEKKIFLYCKTKMFTWLNGGLNPVIIFWKGKNLIHPQLWYCTISKTKTTQSAGSYVYMIKLQSIFTLINIIMYVLYLPYYSYHYLYLWFYFFDYIFVPLCLITKLYFRRVLWK